MFFMVTMRKNIVTYRHHRHRSAQGLSLKPGKKVTMGDDR
jgi:hypothetical protein